jgi:hypothetical protein
MSTDVEKVVSHSADKQLQDIEKKYPGFIHMKSQSGIRLSYKLQKILQADGSGIVRGYRVREGEFPGALNGFLYSILRNTKQQRRALVLSVLKQFDEQVVSYVMINKNLDTSSNALLGSTHTEETGFKQFVSSFVVTWNLMYAFCHSHIGNHTASSLQLWCHVA